MAKLFYYIDLDERGEFSAHVETEEGEVELVLVGFEVFEDGWMQHSEDLVGLRDYMAHLGLCEETAEMIKAN